MFKKGKTIAEASMVDLRKHTPNALKNIKAIKCAGMIFLPENPSAEFTEAFSDIKITAVGNIINLPENTEIKSINGSGILTGNIDTAALYTINGSCIIHSINDKQQIKIIVNGLAIYDNSADIDFVAVNGNAIYVNRSLSENVTYSHNMEINSSVIKNYKKGIVVIAGHDLMLTSDITEEMLSEKELYFVAGHDILCSHEIYGYIAANATAGHRIKV